MRLFLFVILCFQYSTSLSQKHDQVWHFGFQTIDYAMVLDFNYPNDSIYFIPRPIEPWLDNASICDMNGKSLFMSNGLNIVDSSNQIMQNGMGLNPGIVAQWYPSGYPIWDGAMALPNPQNDSLYYLFHLGIDTGGLQGFQVERLYVSTIDMNLNNGKGAVIEKNRLLVSDTLFYGHLEATKHGNGQDWWILIPELHTNGFYRFLLTQDSIYGPYYQKIGQNYTLDASSQAAFSPNGMKYARYSAYFNLDIYDFDRCTGLLSNYLHIPIQDSADMVGGGGGGGVAFSPSSRYLYAFSTFQSYQYDMLATNIPASKDTVAIYDGFTSEAQARTTFYMAQLAPNNKIYVNCDNSGKHIHIIHHPDSAGLACNFEQHALEFPSLTGPSLPNFPHYRTPALAGSACDTITNTITIENKTNNIKLYPNPTAHSLSLEANMLIQKIIVYNALGQIVQQQVNINSSYTQIKTSNLENGTYFIAIFMENEVLNKTFQVLR